MISEFSVHPKPKNKNAKILTLVLFAVAAALFIAYIAVPVYKGMIGVLAIIAITAAILIYTKFISASYYYDITFDINKSPLFVVRQKTGKRETTLCRIDLADIADIKHETNEERRKHKKDISAKLYVYTPTLFPPDVYRITAKNRYDSFEVIIEGTEEFAELLRSYSDEAKLLSSQDDEY